MSRRLAFGALCLIGLITALVLWSRPWQSPATRQESVPREAGALPRLLTGPVVKVVDGDTIDARLDDRVMRVRYMG